MGFNFTAFAGGFAKAAVESIEKEEELAAARGANGAKVMYENYKTVLADNRKLENELKANIETLKAYDPNATEDELFAVATKKPVMDYVVSQIKKENFDPESFKLSNIASIANNNVKSTALDLIKENLRLPKVMKETEASFAYKDTGNFITDIKGAAGSRAAEKAARQTADALGVSYEELVAAKGYKRPEMNVEATYNMGGIKQQPANSQEIINKLEVDEIQAAQKFGENSPERLAIKKQKDFVKSFDVQTDKSLEARADRLALEKLDTQDPARVKEIDKSLAAIYASIKNHKLLTSIADPKEKTAKYNEMKTDVNDYVNTRMREAKGTKWRDMVEFKTYTDPTTDKTIISKTAKVGMTVEQQQEMFAYERKLTAQALKENGYVLPDGTPRTPVAERLMRNFNITAADLESPAARPAPTAAPAAAPAVTPTAKPAAAPVKAVPQLTREDQDALVWANTPANAGPQADAIKKKIQNKINGTN
jgi:hypothetical protein